jgi:hypothetical protein
MKNLLVFVSPTRDFGNGAWGRETEILAKVQIENSLEMGWRPEDIVVATNFEYEHAGVRAVTIPTETYCRHSPTATKVYAIIHMFETGMIEDDELYWFHDFDAFQLEDIAEDEIGMNGHDMGLTDYGRSSINPGRDLRWSTGTWFFRKSAHDIFLMLRREIELYRANEEIALLEMLKKGKYRAVRDRIKKVNITYNLATRKRLLAETYDMADKPLKVIHFHPFDERPVWRGHANVEVCIHGRNQMGVPLVTDRLKAVFERHGIS